MFLSIISKKRKRRRGNNNGNQTVYTQKTWSLKGQEYSTEIDGYATSVNADGTVVVNVNRTASNVPFLNVGRWNSASLSWEYTKINLSIQGGGMATSISDDGNVIAVGFIGGDYTSSTDVVVYSWSGSSWSQRGSAISTRSYDCSIDISGDGSVLAIGEPYFGGWAYGDTRVRIFKWSGSAWNAHGNTIVKTGVSGSQIFGWAVSLNGSGDTLAVGTRSVNSGVDIYRLSGSTWSQLGNRSPYSTEEFAGCDAVKLDSSGDFVAIAGYLSKSTTTGTVRVFRWTGSTWTKVGNDISQISHYALGAPDVSLSMDGTASRIIVGTRYNVDGDSSIKVYDWNGTGWELSATVTHGATNSNNGFNPKLSRDGQTIAFSAPNTKVSAVYTTELPSVNRLLESGTDRQLENSNVRKIESSQ